MTRSWIASVLCISLGGCSETGTALLLEIDASAVPGVEQFHVVGRRDGLLVFGPTIRPETANGALEGKQTLRVLLPDEVAGAPLTVAADGLIAGQSTAVGEATADPIRGREVQVPIVLAASPTPCSGCDGCCNSGQCLAPSVAACGVGGVGCFPCDPVLADQCRSSPGTGFCGCGTGPQCQRAFGADRCVNGACVCGNTTAPCAEGQFCTNGVCQCTDRSCPGCCDAANTCRFGNANTACGTGGALCTTCDAGLKCSNYRCVPG
jgi:hypothetical protein